DRYYRVVSKVGPALRIDDIPDFYKHKKQVIDWEKQFWQHALEPEVYEAAIDTTFALYKPGYPRFHDLHGDFFKALRLGGKYTVRHGGWYVDNDNLTEEQVYYAKTANESNSWK